MQILERTKEEVVNKANTMSDFLKIEYLEMCSQILKDADTLKYCYAELARLYENWIMYNEALKYLARLKSLTVSETEKFKIFEKEIEILIKSGNYDRVENYYRGAVKLTTTARGYEMKRKIVDLYNKEAVKLEAGKKYSSLTKLYEKLIPFLADIEKKDAKRKLAVAYEKIGRFRDSIGLERQVMR